jgi:ubiquitin-protein ligase
VVVKETDTLWDINIRGPEKTPFEGGLFVVRFKLDNFPFKSPEVTFITKIYHPNITDDGHITAHLLGTHEYWFPKKNIVEIMGKIKSLLVVPDPNVHMYCFACYDYHLGIGIW